MTAKTKDPMPTRALAPWFGSGRMIAPLVGRELEGCSWVGIPFAGGMSEVAEIAARSVAVNDLHRHVINLARVVSCDRFRPILAKRLDRLPFHPDALREAQDHCREIDACDDYFTDRLPDLPAAVSYFVCCWMGRSHKAGGVDEFNGGISTRWNANGGDSNVRYRSALRGLAEWGRIMRRCSFTCLDAFEFLDKCPDTAETGIYVDAPWPDDGAKYKHKFDEAKQILLAKRLAKFKRARVVVRFGDHPLIRELYPQSGDVLSCARNDGITCPEDVCDIEHGIIPSGGRKCFYDTRGGKAWAWLEVSGRTQTNETKREVLILNGMSRAEGRLFQ